MRTATIPPKKDRNGTELIYGVAAVFTGRYSELQVEFSTAVRTGSEQEELILKLEHDLSTIQAMASMPRPDADGSEVSNMGNIPEPIKEATAMFTGMSLLSFEILWDNTKKK